MGVKDRELIKLPGFPGGINNVQPETSVPVTALRQAVNVDIDDVGKVRRRTGYVQRIEGDAHSLFSDGERLLAVVDGVLKAVDRNLATTNVRTGMGERPVSYAAAAGDIYWSNGHAIRRITDEYSDAALWVDCPSQPKVATHASGGLPAGTYQVAITYRDADGRESGSTLATMVDVAAGQGIILTNIGANADAAFVRVYVSNANGDDLYQAADFAVGISQWIIGQGRRGKVLETQFLYPLSSGQIVRYFNGRLFVASDNVLRWSEALRYGLTHHDNYIRYRGDRITMFEAVGDGPQSGAYVAIGTRTYWMPGSNPKDWTMNVASHAGAVEGSSTTVSGNLLGIEYSGMVPYWLDTDGVFCVGMPEGRVIRLTQERFAAPQNAERGATILRETNGVRQLLTSIMGGSANRAVASDTAVATVRRNGVTT